MFICKHIGGNSSSGKRAQEPHRQKTNTASFQVPKLPPIKPLQASRPRVQSAYMHCIREHESQVCDLQHRLNEASTENKLLRRLQHRHTVALQYFQNSEDSVSQVGWWVLPLWCLLCSLLRLQSVGNLPYIYCYLLFTFRNLVLGSSF